MVNAALDRYRSGQAQLFPSRTGRVQTARQTVGLAASERERKPARAAARRHPARTAARALKRGDWCTACGSQRTHWRRFAQQRTQRKAARAALYAQRGKEGVEPGANAVDRFGVAPLFTECASAGGVVTQRAYHMAARGARRFQRGAGKAGA
jgi:hypothetical protein